MLDTPKLWRPLIAVAILALAVLACGKSASPQATPTNIPYPTYTPYLTYTPLPKPSNTPKLTNTPVPTATPTPTLSPIERGQLLEAGIYDSAVRIRSGGDHRVLSLLSLGEEYVHFLGLSWSPDGSHFVFSACPTSFEPALMDPNGDGDILDCYNNLYISDRDGTEITTLVYEANYDNFPAWSPNGSWISFSRAPQLVIVRPDGTDSRVVWSNGCIGPSAWSPDSQRIAWYYAPEACDGGWNEIVVINLDGTGWRSLYSFPVKDLTDRIAWSPDGQSLAVELWENTFYLLDANCESGATGRCDESALTKIGSFPEHWLHTFYPRWAGEEAATEP